MVNIGELKKPKRRRQGQCQLKDELIFYYESRVSLKSFALSLGSHNYHETESKTHR